jgi:hypothetical protein
MVGGIFETTYYIITYFMYIVNIFLYISLSSFQKNAPLCSSYIYITIYEEWWGAFLIEQGNDEQDNDERLTTNQIQHDPEPSEASEGFRSLGE